MLEKRPKPELTKTFAEKLFDMLAILTAILTIIYLLIKWTSMPETVPIHFDFSGEPDRWGKRWILMLTLIIGIMAWIGMHFLEKFPQIHNYMWLTKENVQRQYKNSQLLLNVMKNIILIFFSFMAYDSVHVALGKQSIMGLWSMTLFLILLFGPITFFVVRSYRLK